MTNTLPRREREKIQIENSILQHAERLFFENGYENTSMDALATSCEYTKRTIYRYFTSKEDLYFAVLLEGHKRLLDAVRKETQNGRTGYEKIRLSYVAVFQFYTQSGPLFDLMTQVKAIKLKKDPNELPYYKKYADFITLFYKEIISLFDMAQRDNSIRKDVDASQLGFSYTLLLDGFLHMLRLSGDSFTGHFSLDREEFISNTIKLLFELLEDKNYGRE